MQALLNDKECSDVLIIPLVSAGAGTAVCSYSITCTWYQVCSFIRLGYRLDVGVLAPVYCGLPRVIQLLYHTYPYPMFLNIPWYVITRKVAVLQQYPGILQANTTPP